MTTIAYRNGVMAADSRAYSGGKLPIGSKVKIEKLEDGTLLGVSSITPGGGEAVRQWYKEGCNKDNPFIVPEKFSLLVVKPNGEVWFASDNLLLTGPLQAEYFAVGSGEDFALGAMAAGAGPEAAVEIACQLDVWSDGPVIALTL